MKPKFLSAELAESIRKMTRLYGRLAVVPEEPEEGEAEADAEAEDGASDDEKAAVQE